uniref:Opa interacting protein 5 n=1 Tax=Salmo trutta TaxID=8032 RepID=A0A673ZWM9_SALTR
CCCWKCSLSAFRSLSACVLVNTEHTIVENPVTFHCGRCNTVWADSRGICGEATSVNSLICLEVTQDVTINSEREWSLDGLFSACVYNTLQCAGCLCLMGVILYSTPQHLSALRNLFLLKKDEMYCYIFSTGQMVKASTLNFSVAPLGERVSEVRRQLFFFFTLHVNTLLLTIFPPIVVKPRFVSSHECYIELMPFQ